MRGVDRDLRMTGCPEAAYLVTASKSPWSPWPLPERKTSFQVSFEEEDKELGDGDGHSSIVDTEEVEVIGLSLLMLYLIWLCSANFWMLFPCIHRDLISLPFGEKDRLPCVASDTSPTSSDGISCCWCCFWRLLVEKGWFCMSLTTFLVCLCRFMIFLTVPVCFLHSTSTVFSSTFGKECW